MDYREKLEKFSNKTPFELSSSKTPIDELPLNFDLSSGSKHPEDKSGGMITADTKLWVKFLDKWFKPYGRFDKLQILGMIELCHNDNEIISLMELLSATEVPYWLNIHQFGLPEKECLILIRYFQNNIPINLVCQWYPLKNDSENLEGVARYVFSDINWTNKKLFQISKNKWDSPDFEWYRLIY